MLGRAVITVITVIVIVIIIVIINLGDLGARLRGAHLNIDEMLTPVFE